MQKNESPIGIFDSGIGGLTVYRALKEILPGERFVYLGDTARLPYGTKSPGTIIRFSLENAEFLLQFDIKALVVACNTSSSVAIEDLKKKYPHLVILGVIEPSARRALEVSRGGKIGVIGTEATIRSGKYQKILRQGGAEVYAKACPLFVPLVEEGWIYHPVTRMVAEEYLRGWRDKIDTLILGCTHYPVIKKAISEAVGDDKVLVESGEAVGLELREILRERNLLRETPSREEDLFFVTDFLEKFERVSSLFLGRKVKIEERKFSLC